jgi:hypothetical protein
MAGVFEYYSKFEVCAVAGFLQGKEFSFHMSKVYKQTKWLVCLKIIPSLRSVR